MEVKGNNFNEAHDSGTRSGQDRHVEAASHETDAAADGHPIRGQAL